MEEFNIDTLVDFYTKNSSIGNEKVEEILKFASTSNGSFHPYYVTKYIIGNISLILAYSILFIINLFGNLLVCYVVFHNRRMHTVTNLFIVNMALADILVMLLNIPFNIPRQLIDNWPFGNVICYLCNFSLMVSVYVSTFIMTAISIDRHQVIHYPLRPRISMALGAMIVIAIWIVAFSFSIPFVLYQKVENVTFLHKHVTRCTGDYPSKSFEQILTISTVSLQYVLPLVIIAAMYGRVVYKLWVRTQLGEITQNQLINQATKKRKSIKMLITVVIVFGLCWMPINLYHIITEFHPDKMAYKHNSTAFYICHWIAISSTCYNPFIYCWLNETFRREIKKFFLCFCGSAYVHRDEHLVNNASQNLYRMQTMQST